MISAVGNYDVLCLQMRNHSDDLDAPLKKEMANLLSTTRELLTSSKNLRKDIVKTTPWVFNFRIKAIRWLVSESNFDLSSIFDELAPQIEGLRSNPKLEVLTENILFAVRCNKRVVKYMSQTGTISDDTMSTAIVNLPEINYEQFLASIAVANMDDATCQSIIDMTNASLLIEFITLAAVLIDDEGLKVSSKTIHDLEFLIADAAQEYSALAMEMGLLPSSKTSQTHAQHMAADKSFHKEQKQLSELGLNDFAKTFDN